ncbi:MAG: glycosyltransferase involved in cell wall biosynthesis [Granulosicoccus sp.]|jgi:glycosyltransferase involved in cell wall biosynthesis
MKVGIFTGALASGGAEKQSLILASVLGEDHQVCVISYFGSRRLPRMVEFAEQNNMDVRYLEGSPLSKAFEFRTICKQEQFDAIFCYLPSNNLIGGLFAIGTGVKKVIGGVRTNSLAFPKSLTVKLAHNLLVDHSIINNQGGLNHFADIGWKRDKFTFIPNCIDHIPEAIDHNHDGPVRIITVARFEPYKDYGTAFKAIRILKEKLSGTPVEYRVLGTGSLEEEVKQMIKAEGLEDTVKLILDPNDINSHYRECDIFFLTSILEGFSNTILEAMAHSLPIVATNAGDNSTMVREGENGFLTDVGDAENLAERLLELAQDSNKLKALGQSSHSIVNDEFGTKAFKRNYTNFLDKLMQQ